MFNLKMDILKDDAELSIINGSVAPDVMSGGRSKASLELARGALLLSVESEDSVALRATLNTILRQIRLVEDTIEVLGGYDGRQQ